MQSENFPYRDILDDFENDLKQSGYFFFLGQFSPENTDNLFLKIYKKICLILPYHGLIVIMSCVEILLHTYFQIVFVKISFCQDESFTNTPVGF